MKRFRVNNLTVSIGNAEKTQFGCGVNFSCPGGPAGSICNQFTPPIGPPWPCGFFSNNCIFTRNCGFTLPGCGLNFSTIQPRDLPKLIQMEDPAQQLELIAGLKEDLSVALEQLEIADKQVTELSSPQSLDDVEELEENLKSALSEVQAMKKNFK